ncbi:phage integrase N-terminal domain-containing protein [Thalassotalea ganghwensis]
MTNFEYQIKGLLNRNKDGSYSTQEARSKILFQIAKQLNAGGYKHLIPENLKPKHVQFLLDKWKEDGISTGTIKNRMSHVRWLAEKVGKPSMIPKSNTGTNNAIKLDIEKRSYIPTQSKGKELDAQKLDKVTDRHVKLSLKMQREFGLRREEAIKFRPSFAMQGDKISLKASWCKGGRAREIPVLTESQKAVLAEVKALAGNGSLIPANKSYVQQLKVYENQTSQVGLDKNHGLRHRYAQDRYETLAGWKCPVEGGISRKDMSPEQKEIDREVRLQITEELGHGREQITTAYLGR